LGKRHICGTIEASYRRSKYENNARKYFKEKS